MKLILCIAFTLVIATVLSVPPQANMLFPQLVGELNYPVETHYIQTADGYINTYFRIQAKNTTIQSGKPVIYFQHGLLDSSDSCVMNNETLAPGLILANSGYDVWAGNTRGNRYSLGHIQWNSSDPNSTYWDFSWQDMSMYDLPAAFAYINNQTGQMINYIGHSQGTSIMFAALSRQDQSIIQYLRRFIALGPVAYVDHSTSEVIHLTADSELGKWLNIANMKEFLFLTPDQKDFLEENCEYVDAICLDVIKAIADYEPDVDNDKMMDVFVGHFPAGTSIQNMNYWNQMALNTQFQWYNYGTEGNIQHYNQQTPPYYNLSLINVPVHLYSGIYDELADPTDVAHLNASLTGSPNVTWNTYLLGHLSFLIGLNTSYIYDVIDAIEWVSDVEIDI